MQNFIHTALAIVLMAAPMLFSEEISLMDTAKWSSHYPKSQITTDADGVVSLTKGASFEIRDRIVMDPSRRYEVTVEGCTDAANGTLSLCFIPYTADGRRINTENIVCAHLSLTEIAEDARPGDTTIKVRDISRFTKGVMGSCLLGIGAKDDFSDLPNFHLIKLAPEQDSTQKDGVYTLNLAAPLKETLTAGTPVRQHYYGSAFYFLHGMRQRLTGQWQRYESHLSGVAKQCSPVKFPRGTAAIRIQVFCGIPETATAKLRNLKLTILPKKQP